MTATTLAWQVRRDFTLTDCSAGSVSLHGHCGNRKAIFLLLLAGWDETSGVALTTRSRNDSRGVATWLFYFALWGSAVALTSFIPLSRRAGEGDFVFDFLIQSESKGD